MASARAPPPAQLGSLWSALEDQRGGAHEEELVPFLLSSSSSASWGGLPGAREREKEGLLRRAGAAVERGWGAARAAAEELWALARADPRKAVFAAKVGLALALISLLVFVREPRDIVSHSVWAILTVVVVFEFSIGTYVQYRALGPISSSASSSLGFFAVKVDMLFDGFCAGPTVH
ncbi:Os06g0269000 [Oryza sativa Japonica Group]|uniref:Os06g0269000 protein n=1 Tax=Oryza sativa subsp. japonica TaxID=39947 RepID=A0A0P0WVK8_ORYSJ|nr:Os06g0269000 [Oryza sativa Japonica Group]